MENKKIVKRWRGSRETYNRLANNNELNYWTHYSVKESNGTWSEYYGKQAISTPSGQPLPVLDIVDTLPSTLNPGDRYLVGTDSNENNNAEYYIVTIDSDSTNENGISYHIEEFLNNSGISVRVINRNSMAYQLVNGKIHSYDIVETIIDGGFF